MKSHSKLIAVVGVLTGIALVAGGAHHLSAQDAGAVDLDGEYVLRRSAMTTESAARNAAIGAATSRLDAPLQKRWHAVLELSSMPAPKLTIATASDEIAIAKGDRPALKTPASGATRPIADGHTVKQQLEGRNLVQTISSSVLVGLALTAPVQQVSRYRLAQDARSLDVETTISGGALIQPIVFHTTYDRL
jgi:hypothetical protein